MHFLVPKVDWSKHNRNWGKISHAIQLPSWHGGCESGPSCKETSDCAERFCRKKGKLSKKYINLPHKGSSKQGKGVSRERKCSWKNSRKLLHTKMPTIRWPQRGLLSQDLALWGAVHPTAPTQCSISSWWHWTLCNSLHHLLSTWGGKRRERRGWRCELHQAQHKRNRKWSVERRMLQCLPLLFCNNYWFPRDDLFVTQRKINTKPKLVEHYS